MHNLQDFIILVILVDDFRQIVFMSLFRKRHITHRAKGAECPRLVEKRQCVPQC